MPTSRASLLAAWEKLQAGLEANQDELQLVNVYRQQLDAELTGLQACQSRDPTFRPNPARPPRTSRPPSRGPGTW